jgi:hypothetical protein
VLEPGATRIDTIYRKVHVPRVKTDRSAGWFSELETINAGALPHGLTATELAGACWGSSRNRRCRV